MSYIKLPKIVHVGGGKNEKRKDVQEHKWSQGFTFHPTSRSDYIIQYIQQEQGLQQQQSFFLKKTEKLKV